MTLGAFHLGGSTWGNMATKGVALEEKREVGVREEDNRTQLRVERGTRG